MNREKQIEEMAKAICSEYDCVIPCRRCDYYEYANCRDVKSAEKLYNAGYRKSTDLAEEIFAEIEVWLDGSRYSLAEMVWGIKHSIEELKKKYTEGK